MNLLKLVDTVKFIQLFYNVCKFNYLLIFKLFSFGILYYVENLYNLG